MSEIIRNVTEIVRCTTQYRTEGRTRKIDSRPCFTKNIRC